MPDVVHHAEKRTAACCVWRNRSHVGLFSFCVGTAPDRPLGGWRHPSASKATTSTPIAIRRRCITRTSFTCTSPCASAQHGLNAGNGVRCGKHRCKCSLGKAHVAPLYAVSSQDGTRRAKCISKREARAAATAPRGQAGADAPPPSTAARRGSWPRWPQQQRVHIHPIPVRVRHPHRVVAGGEGQREGFPCRVARHAGERIELTVPKLELWGVVEPK